MKSNRTSLFEAFVVNFNGDVGKELFKHVDRSVVDLYDNTNESLSAVEGD